MAFCTCFPPAGSSDPVIMILGSMPGPTSLKKNQYYGHPQNAFWRIMGDLFGAFPHLEYEARLKILAGRRIGLWESLQSCVRPGSSDSAISKAIPNDFNGFFAGHPHVEHLFFDGAPAFNLFKKYALPTLERTDIKLTALPSTSPRNAKMRYEDKLEAWKVVQSAVFQGTK